MGTGGPDPLLLDHRVTTNERRLNSHSEDIKANTRAIADLHQTVALMQRDLAEICRMTKKEIEDRKVALEAERTEREERDVAWERRVTRVTGWTATLAGTILAGSVGTILTFILTRGT